VGVIDARTIYPNTFCPVTFFAAVLTVRCLASRSMEQPIEAAGGGASGYSYPMQNRSLVIAIVAFALGLMIGSTLAPVSIWPRRSIEPEIASLREEVRIYKEMVAGFKAERGEVRKVLENK
jgi:hypothetical protein